MLGTVQGTKSTIWVTGKALGPLAGQLGSLTKSGLRGRWHVLGTYSKQQKCQESLSLAIVLDAKHVIFQSLFFLYHGRETTLPACKFPATALTIARNMLLHEYT